jgi:hypothetical protein
VLSLKKNNNSHTWLLMEISIHRGVRGNDNCIAKSKTIQTHDNNGQYCIQLIVKTPSLLLLFF